MRKKITFTDTISDVIVTMAEGNPGALTALMELAKQPNGLFLILDLDDMGMRGPQVYVAYNDFCGRDIAKFAKCCRDRDEKMIRAVNAHPGVKGSPRAVKYGASST